MAFDFLVYDMPFIEHDLLTRLKTTNPNGKIIALDFADYRFEQVDHVFNLFNHGDFSAAGDNKHTKFDSGFHFAIIREEFFPYRLDGVLISEQIESLLITFGGSDPSGNTIAALKALSALQGGRITVVKGPLFQHEQQLSELAQQSGLDIEVMGSVKDIGRLMTEASVVICGGGTTMLESLFLGRPTIVMPQTPSELVFASQAASRNACLVVNPQDGGDLVAALTAIESKKDRNRVSRNAMALVDGEGVDLIIGDIIHGSAPDNAESSSD